jgi:pimeloyl-ACP methyl ester carboxylesterase
VKNMTIGTLAALLLSATTASFSERVWVLLHGVGGSGRDWRYVAPALAGQGQTVLRPSLPNRAGLFDWAENVVEFFERSSLLEREDRSVLLVAHSFGGAVVLFLLRTAYELNHNNLVSMETQLGCAHLRGRAVGACQKIKAGWQALMRDPARAQRWVRAAQKISHVFLYHAALRGACGADVDLVGLGGEATASLQLLAQQGDFFYHPVEHISWEGQITITNLYGGRKYMLSLCGLCGNDSMLSYEQQRLSLQAPGYREIFFDHRSHFDFALSPSAGRQLAQSLKAYGEALPGGVR